MIEPEARKYDIISASAESTVVAEYVAEPSEETAYQSEADLERELIGNLQSQAYEYLRINSEAELIANLRHQLELLNRTTFSEQEWQTLFRAYIAGTADGIKEKSFRIHHDSGYALVRDNGETKNIWLIDKTNIHNNRLQVLNQYEVGRETHGAAHDNRYDVTILVNGLPLVHVELKRRGIAIREAFNQIQRYQRDSFWAGSGLFDYVQLFVISNGTHTKYYSNTTRQQHVSSQQGTKSRNTRGSNTYEFTSWWADAANNRIYDLVDFTKTFFAKHTILNVLTKYCVRTEDGTLLVMRPYQIVATERILRKIEIATTYKQLGTLDAGGYVWHTTGSGKTLTSFKTAQLATQLPSVDKVLFVVDRKDLDYQTMREYDRFQKDSANSNTSTAVLKQQLEDPSKKIIITTIQKLSTFIASNRGHQIYSGHVVLIFDECHRSQFGDMHTAITRAFKNYNLFGFTGTPIFAANAGTSGNYNLRTTEQAFGEKLHTYTIVDAIRDENVLPFRVEYCDTIKLGNVEDRKVAGIDTESALLAPERIREVVEHTLAHFNQKTKRASTYDHKVVTNVTAASSARRNTDAITAKRRVRGFNAIFATASIDAAKAYYLEFKRQQETRTEAQRLRIATIFSYGANEPTPDGALDEEQFDVRGLNQDTRGFLEDAIGDYNRMFATNYDTSSDSFQSYYKDISLRLKNNELDMVIVVNMFLTGFDATSINTLFVDKNLRMHGLIQAFSRTNRILNSVKTYGNIVCYRNLEQETNAALELFGNKDARGAVLLKPYAEYFNEYADAVTELRERFPLDRDIIGEQAQKDFINAYSRIVRVVNILTAFDEFEGQTLLSDRDRQNYEARYTDIHASFKRLNDADRESIATDVVFEIELIKQVEINVDYILMRVEQMRQQRGDGEDHEIAAEINRAVAASPTLHSKKDLIEAFINNISIDGTVDEQWRAHIETQRRNELNDIITRERLKPLPTEAFIHDAFRDGALNTSGTRLASLLPAVSRFGKQGNQGEIKARVVERLRAFFERFYGLITDND